MDGYRAAIAERMEVPKNTLSSRSTGSPSNPSAMLEPRGNRATVLKEICWTPTFIAAQQNPPRCSSMLSGKENGLNRLYDGKVCNHSEEVTPAVCDNVAILESVRLFLCVASKKVKLSYTEGKCVARNCDC